MVKLGYLENLFSKKNGISSIPDFYNLTTIYIEVQKNNFTADTPLTPSQEGNKPVEIRGFIPLLRGARGVSDVGFFVKLFF